MAIKKKKVIKKIIPYKIDQAKLDKIIPKNF